MIERIGRRFVSLLLTFVTILTLLSAMTLPALAATSGTVTGLSNTDIGLNFTGTADGAWNAGGAQIIGKVKSTQGSGCGDSDTKYRSTLTITNKKSTKATLSFDYTVVPSAGTILVNNTTTTTDGSFEKELDAGGTIEIEIESGSTSADTKITITNISLLADVSATVTFLPAENGSYTVNGKKITETHASTQSSTAAYLVEATPADGYRFKGWYNVDTGMCINTNAKASLNFDSNCTITARFASKDLALFETGGWQFDDLNEAITEAQKNLPATITLVGSGKITGNYTIPSNVTLLIPFDDNRTDYTTMPGTTGLVAAKKNQSVYTTLTMDEGSQITVYGNISLPAQVSSANSSYTGVISGPCGTIHMKPSSSIVLKDGSNLYCWGFITGTGDIKAESGATVYEEFQICDYRGGSKTSSLNNGQKVFPFTQYYVQNIEATLEIEYGAKEIAVCRLHSTSYTKANVSLNFITRDSGGLFNLQPGSSFVKKYDSATERVTYEVIGDANLSSITIDAGATVKSQNFNLPIMQNTTINVKSGTTTINQSLCLIPGSQVIIDEGATVNIADGKSVFVYDRSDWVYKEWDKETIVVNGQTKPKYANSGFSYPGSTDFKPEYYTPSRSSDNSKCWTSKFTTADMKDVKWDVNGTLNVNGKLYTTQGGADITSSLGSGKVVLSTAPTGNITTHQYMQPRMEYNFSSGKYDKDVSDYKNISANPAKLHNADGGYTPTAGASAGATFTYCKCQDCGNGTWVKDVAAINDSTGKQVTTHNTLQDAVGNLKADQYIKLLHNTTEKTINVNNKSLYLDLNGRTVKGDISVTNGYKLYGMDSTAGEDYVTAPSGKIVGTVTGCAPTYQTPGDTNDRYVAILGAENGTPTLSFHRFNISVTGYRFELTTGGTPQCALFFIGKFQGDDAAKKYLSKLGFTLKDDNDTQLGKADYEFTADTVIPEMPADGKESTSEVVRSGDAFLFEVYLKRSFDKAKPDGYTKKISATAQATFKNNGTQDSEPKQWSFEDAWTNPGELDETQQAILDKFLKALNIPNP
mgnify:CR=1 FL=1